MPSVTLKDIYQIMERMEDKMDSRLKTIETRVDTLEDFKSRAVGIWLGVTAVISILGSWLGEKIFKL